MSILVKVFRGLGVSNRGAILAFDFEQGECVRRQYQASNNSPL